MLTGKSVSQNALPTPVSLGFNVLFEKTDISTPFQKQTIAKTSEREQVELDPYPESDYQWLVEVLEALTDIVNRNVNNDFAALTEADYEQLDAVLKELIYTVGDNGKHPLAPLMDLIGDLIIKYENIHFPKLTELFPELRENTKPNDAKNKARKGNYTTDISEKLTNNLATEAFFSIGSLFFKGGREEKAIFAYDQAIHLNSEYAHAYYDRGRAKGLLGQYVSGIADFDETLRLIPNFAEAYLMRGCAKAALESYKSASADFDETLRLKPDDTHVYFARGCVKMQLEQYEAAIADFDKGLQLNPDVAYAYFMRGHARVELGNLQSALTDCDEAIRLDPSWAEAYDIRGKANAFLGRTQEAKEDFQKALELAEQDDNQDLKTEIEQSLEKLNNTE